MVRREIEEELKVYHNIDIEYKWVRGYQDTKLLKDKKNKDTSLSPQAKLNIFCNKRAGQYRKQPDSEKKKLQKSYNAHRSSGIL